MVHPPVDVRPLLRLRGSGGWLPSLGDPALVMEDFSSQAYEWTVNIATAAALVAGASLASLFDHGLHIELSSSRMIGGPRAALAFHHVRMFSSVLLALAFAFEISTVFAATVTGTMLLSRGHSVHSFDPVALSATHLLHRELEFEYCLIRAGFFQGLINWLAAIGLRLFVSLATPPSAVANDMVEGADDAPDTPQLARKRLALGVGLMLTMLSLVMVMIAFYNYHLNYYRNYVEMLSRLRQLAWQRYIVSHPARWLPRMAFLAVLGAASAFYMAFALPTA